ncbi:MAG TPA: 50S ribosomal protein L30 [Candidatus Eisenbacteria bacterium]|jgi:large subunit ribosomal protein L30|nr:50S ribosomal protein L30 [Candidatus Eisenbacteria bacterium]
MPKLKIKQVRSASRREASQGATLRALGITRNQMTVVHEATPQIRGMVNKVRHLVVVEETK